MSYPETEEELAEAWAMRVTRDWWDSLPPFAYRGLSMHDSTRLRIIVEKAISNALAGKKPPITEALTSRGSDIEEMNSLPGEHWWQK